MDINTTHTHVYTTDCMCYVIVGLAGYVGYSTYKVIVQKRQRNNNFTVCGDTPDTDVCSNIEYINGSQFNLQLLNLLMLLI